MIPLRSSYNGFIIENDFSCWNETIHHHYYVFVVDLT